MINTGKRLALTAVVAMTLIALMGCGGAASDPGAKYVGEWKQGEEILTIRRNDGGFIVDSTASAKEKVPAVLENGVLVIKTGRGDLSVMIDGQTGNLLVPHDGEYKRRE